jgi:3-phenylpropionate/cinnamic acid dioxygenase small subunit
MNLANYPDTHDRPFADDAVHAHIRGFLDREAELIDSRRYREWLDLVTDDFSYRMPVPITPDNPESPHFDPEGIITDESKETLTEHWFRRFERDMWEMAWGEVPPVRLRHFVTNVRVRVIEDGVYDVRSNAMVTATRQSEQADLLAVERFDVVESKDGRTLLRSRFTVAETTVIKFASLRVVL